MELRWTLFMKTDGRSCGYEMWNFLQIRNIWQWPARMGNYIFTIQLGAFRLKSLSQHQNLLFFSLIFLLILNLSESAQKPKNSFIVSLLISPITLLVSLPEGNKLTTMHSVRDVKWYKEQAIYGWNHQAIWRLGDDEPAVIRCATVDPVPNRSLLVCGDSSGSLSIYRYPSQFTVASHTSMPGCATSISRVSFTADGERLIALDSKTRTVIQYKIDASRVTIW